MVDYIPELVEGLIVTLKVLGLAILVAVPVAFVLGLARHSSRRLLRAPAALIVETIRGSSLVVQLFWAFYVFPFFGLPLSPLTTAVAVIGLNEGSYSSEVVRGGIVGVPGGQTEAAKALNFSTFDRYRMVILPQALLIMLPWFTNSFINILKGSALVALVTVPDFTYRGLVLRERTGDTLTIFLLLLAGYFIISALIAGLLRLMEWRLSLHLGVAPRAMKTSMWGFLR